VVFRNLRKVYPELSRQERKRIARRFYLHLADLMLESAVAHFDSDRRISQRMGFSNPELMDALHQKGKHVVLITAHYGNWEFLINVPRVTPYRLLGAYKPLRNRYFDRMVKKSRQRFNSVPVPMAKIARAMIEHKRDGLLAASLFVADQRPHRERIQYWTTFLGRETPFYLGAEKMARKIDAAVVFAKIRKVKRFRYRCEFELITEDPRAPAEHEITEAHIRILEGLIAEEPAHWLWSHKRWKYKRDQDLSDR
jgi:KDO2-lipid IV(A) lauroyltransferase